MENWISIEGYEKFYMVSSHGAVAALKKTVVCNRYGKEYIQQYPRKLLKLTVSRYGYLVVGLFDRNNPKAKQYLVHRLVARAFLQNDCTSKTQVNHMDGDKTNNHFANLEWVTGQENVDHAWAIGLNNHIVGWSNPRSKLTKEQVAAIKDKHTQKIASIRHLAREYSVDPNVIRKIINGKGYYETNSQHKLLS